MIIDLRAADAATCGGKAGTLGRLLRAGVRVPDGFVVPPTAEPDSFMPPAAEPDGLVDPPAAEPDRTRRRPTPTGPHLSSFDDAVMAVRSSASGEDTAHASAAGQHDSFLGVRGASAIAAAVRACRESLWSERAVAYRRARGQSGDPVMAVLVQRHIDAEVAGVAFTGDTVRVEAAWGLGESVAHGLVTPDAWTVTPAGITARATGDKHTRVDRASDGGTARTAVSTDDRYRPCLTDERVREVARTARRVEGVLGVPVDVEWALAGGEIWVLQARPVTASPPTATPAGTPPAGKPAAGTPHAPTAATLSGTPGSSGTATGPARILRGPADFSRARPGDIIVCRSTDPSWTPLFGIAAAFVTETGGVLSHAAIVAREHRIPAVLGVPDAMSTIPDGQTVTVDGDAGTVLT